MFLTALKAKLAAMVVVAGLNTDDMPGISKDMLTTLESLASAQKAAAEDPGKGPDVNASFNEALAKVNELAQKGDKDAQYALAHWGVLSNSNLNEVAALYRKAADQGHLLAKVELAQVLLQAGQQNEANVKEAVKLIQEAEAGDNKVARRLLANLHLGGVGGVEQSVKKAQELLEKGSAAGDGEATLGLSQLFTVGATGLPKDEKKALDYLIKASEQGNPVAMSTYAARLFDGDPEGSSQLVKKDPEQAKKMFEDAAAKGFAAANRLLGAIYENGMGGTAKDLEKAVEYYTKAANGNDAQALFRLGNYFEAGLTEGEGDKAKVVIQKNDKSALDLYRLAAQNGLPEAFFNVGVYYETGTVVDKDPEKAFTYFLRAANNGLAQAQFRLAGLYQNGTGVAQDVVAAKGWYQLAADRGNVAAQISLGQMYEAGVGGAANAEVAAQYYSNAAAAGAPLAMLRLASLAERGLNPAKTPADKARALAWADMAVDASNKAELAVKYRDELKAGMKTDEIAEAKKIYDQLKKSSTQEAPAGGESKSGR